MATTRALSEKQQRIHEGLKEKSFGIKDIKKLDEKNVRQLRYWIALGLLGKTTDEVVGQDKFNFYEFMWALIIRELKELNFDNDIIKRCADEVFGRRDRNYNMLEFEKAILFTLVNRKDSYFVINKRGEFEVYRPDDLSKIAEKNRFHTCVILNILPLAKGFLYLGDFIDYISERELLKENEIKALQLLQGNKEASVKIGTGHRRIAIEPGNEAPRAFIDAIFTHEYQSISIQF